MILWKFTLREIKSRPGRATLTLLSIVIGVAAVVAVTVGTATTNQACQEMYLSVAGRAALEVVAEGDGFFDEDVAAKVEQTPGVKAAVPSVQRLSSLRLPREQSRPAGHGDRPGARQGGARLRTGRGRVLQKKYEALLETGFARGLGVGVGDEVKLGTTAADSAAA